MKYDIKDPEHAFYLYNQLDGCLFSFGYGDIYVYKESDKTQSSCQERSFSYKEYQMHFVENNIQNISHHNELL